MKSQEMPSKYRTEVSLEHRRTAIAVYLHVILSQLQTTIYTYVYSHLANRTERKTFSEGNVIAVFVYIAIYIKHL
jgi:hypothetical protein